MALTIDTIRNLVSDTGTPPLLEDPAYQTIIDLGTTNAYRAAGVACRQLAALFASKVDLKAEGVKLNFSQKAEAYTELAKYYDKLADQGLGEDPDSPVTPVAGGAFGAILTGVSIEEMINVKEDLDRYPDHFGVGMDNNRTSTDG